ncbi:unnamed protein product [Protopolystoma xenopodis]|uniref:Protein kinase domain-containing protein n=1 Tax=Protopolystoma xenopodis TaxID=117903 RepID=A0A3S5AA32_9PLAT|nr:unnamed protein product [Protopolystoma xenopodis]
MANRFGEQIGQGAYGPVYRGGLTLAGTYENGQPTPVYLKALTNGTSANLQADFRREANVMAELRHPNVLSLLGVSMQQAP